MGRNVLGLTAGAAVLGLCAPWLLAAEKSPAIPPRYLSLNSFDLRKLVPPPPAPGSIAAQADLETVLHLQANRTKEQVAFAQLVADDDLFNNAGVLGTWFKAENLPLTRKFFTEVFPEAYTIFLAANELHERDRPPIVDKRVRPAIPLPGTNSYPSAHAWQAWFWGFLLAEIYPDKRDELLERARAAAWSRVVAGVHFPSDVAASRRVAEATVAELMKKATGASGVRASRLEGERYMK